MEKTRYMISDAANLVNVEAHVLRYWEEELELAIPRNEMGHRYYTKENLEQFLKIKELKEQGYQLKAIKMIVQNKPVPEDVLIREMPHSESGSLEKPGGLKTELVSAVSKAGMQTSSPKTGTSLLQAEDKMAQFRQIMTGIVRDALEENNKALGQEVGSNVGERVLKEMNYLMREQDEQEEERFRKLDAAIREVHSGKRGKTFRKKKEKEPRHVLVNKEAAL